MKQILLCIIGACMMSSCATILNKPITTVNIYGNAEDSILVRVKSDTTTFGNTQLVPTVIEVPRRKRALVLELTDDTIVREAVVDHKVSPKVWIDFAFVYLPVPLLELLFDKAYTYPSILVDMDATPPYYIYDGKGTPRKPKVRTAIKHKSFPQTAKHQVNLNLSLPILNNLYLNKGNTYGNIVGPMGVEAGIEYNLTDKHRVSVNIGMLNATFDFYDHYYDYYDNRTSENGLAWYSNLMYGSRYKRLHYDIGLGYSRTYYKVNRWELLDEVFPGYNEHTERIVRQNTLGLSASLRFRIVKGFHVSLNYRPSFFVFDSKHFSSHYSHTLSLGLGWTFKLINGKQ